MSKFSGKIVNNQKYVHLSAFFLLDAKEQSLIELASKFISNNDFNVVRLDLRKQSEIALLKYEDFNSTAFPALLRSWKIDTVTGNYVTRSYSMKNPPILHRKELLIDRKLDEYEIYSMLTKKLEEIGAFKNMHKYGTRKRWETHLYNLNLEIRDHSVYQIR